MRPAQCINYVDGVGVVNLFGTESVSLVDVAANRRNHMHAARARHLDRVAADPAGRAHHNQTLAWGDLQYLERPQRRGCRDWQRGRMFVGDAIGNTSHGLRFRAGDDGRVLGIGTVCPCHAEDTLASLQIACSCRTAFDHAREVNTHDKGVRGGSGRPFEGLESRGFTPA